MSGGISPEEQYLLDRQAVLDCVARYCRAVDRLDHELLSGVFHSDALIETGDFKGGPDEFVEQALSGLEKRYSAQSHNITSHNCRLDGNIAHAETYVLFFGLRSGTGEVYSLGARCIDRLERRNGEWRIASRRLVKDWAFTADGSESASTAGGWPRGRRDRDDVSYKRPFELTPELRARLEAKYG